MKISIYCAQSYSIALGKAAPIETNRSPSEIRQWLDKRVSSMQDTTFSCVTDVAPNCIGHMVHTGVLSPDSVEVFYYDYGDWVRTDGYDEQGVLVEFPYGYFSWGD